LVYGDSLLVVQQVNKEWDINKDTMDVYVEEIRKLENKFSGLEIHHIDRDNNVGADVLSKLGSTRVAIPPGVFVHELHHPSVKVQNQQTTDTKASATVREVMMIEEDWRIQFIDFIREFKDILREIHEGVCGNHAASRTLVAAKPTDQVSSGQPLYQT